VCGNTQPFTVWGSVNASLDPELKGKLLDGTLTLFKCEKCGDSGQVPYELMYHDMEQKVMFLVGEAGPDMSLLSLGPAVAKLQGGYTYRLVDCYSELIEKILIWDAGLDDRTVEVFKELFLRTITGESSVYFSRICDGSEDEMEFVVVKETGNGVFPVPFQGMFRVCEATVCKDLPSVESERHQWIKVDREYAMKYIGSRSAE